MKKCGKILSLAVALTMITGSFAGTAVFAASGTTEDGIKYRTSGSSVTITGFDESKLDPTLEIPNKIDDRTVTKTGALKWN